MLSWGALVLLTARAVAQIPAHSNVDYQDVKPVYENGNAEYSDPVPAAHRPFLGFNPVDFEPFARPFGPAETSGYGNGPRPKIGFFGSYERLYWSFSKPATAEIGSVTAEGPAINPISFEPTIWTNTADTGWMQANPAWGNRTEVGYIDTNDYGWLASVLDHVSQGQFTQVQNARVNFDDPAHLLDVFFLGFNLGKFPPNFVFLNLKNVTKINGVEIMRMYRPPRLHDGGYIDVMWGARFLQLDDTFVVNGDNVNVTNFVTGSTSYFFDPLSNSTWSTRAQNNMIGPQVGLRWAHQRARWIWSSEFRFLGAANFQGVHQKTSLGDVTGPNLTLFGPDPLNIIPGIGSRTHSFATTFSPVGELRLQFSYQATSNVALKFGYTGLVMGNITRASNRIDYSGPTLVSILPGGIHQTFYSNGINFGVEVNR